MTPPSIHQHLQNQFKPELAARAADNVRLTSNESARYDNLYSTHALEQATQHLKFSGHGYFTIHLHKCITEGMFKKTTAQIVKEVVAEFGDSTNYKRFSVPMMLNELYAGDRAYIINRVIKRLTMRTEPFTSKDEFWTFIKEEIAG